MDALPGRARGARVGAKVVATQTRRVRLCATVAEEASEDRVRMRGDGVAT